MAKASEVLALAGAALQGDVVRARGICRMMAANEPGSSSLKAKLDHLLNRDPLRVMMSSDVAGLLLSVDPEHSLGSLELPVRVREEVSSFVLERRYADAVRAAGLPVAHKVLLSGPPGNGKTGLAGALAAALDLPFLVLDFSAVLSSHLGETGAKIAKVFRGVTQSPVMLFIDEMETVLSERAGAANSTDVGEVKRIVSTLLLEMDRLPDHVILVGATNHDEMLDRAVLRRFDRRWTLPCPNEYHASIWLQRFAERYPTIPILESMPALEVAGRSYSELERDVRAWCVAWVIAQARSERATA